MKHQEFFIIQIIILPEWADPENLSFMQAIKIINYRMKNKSSDNMKPETLI